MYRTRSLKCRAERNCFINKIELYTIEIKFNFTLHIILHLPVLRKDIQNKINLVPIALNSILFATKSTLLYASV